MFGKVHRIACLALALGIVVGSTSNEARATSCYSAASRMGSDIGKQMATILGAAGCTAVSGDWLSCYQSATKWAEIVDQSISYWNKMASSSWAAIGPRDIVLGDSEEGTIYGTTGRVFVTTTTMPSSSAQVTITERDGKGKVGISICKADANGNMTELKEVTLNDTTSEKNDESQSVTYTASGLKNCVLVIHLDGKSVTNKFAYRIKVVPQ